MMFLDLEELIARALIVLAVLLVVAGFTATYYYGRTLMHEVVAEQADTVQLKASAGRLDQETVEIRSTVQANTKDLKNAINSTTEEVKSQSGSLKQLHQEHEKAKTETKAELARLKESLVQMQEQAKQREQWLVDQIKARDTVIEKNRIDAKHEVSALHAAVQNKERELAELKTKLDKEIELRNKNLFNR